VHRDIGTEVLHHPPGHPMQFVIGVILPRDDQGGQFDPDIGFVGEVDQSLEHRLDGTTAQSFVEVVCEGFEVDVRGIHMGEELAPWLRQDLSGRDCHCGDTRRMAGCRHVGCVLEEYDGIIVGKSHAGAADGYGCPGDGLWRCGVGQAVHLAGLGDVPVLTEFTGEIAAGGPE